jgi:hypothetical protein
LDYTEDEAMKALGNWNSSHSEPFDISLHGLRAVGEGIFGAR